MNRFLLAALSAIALVLATATPARAQSLVSTFTTVDAVRVDGDDLSVTGLLSGETAPTERTWNFATGGTTQIAALQSCEKLALMAMAKPGAYLLEMTTQSQYYYYPKCKLIRRVP